MTDAELNRMEEIPLHSDVARLVAELRSAQAENERLLGAFRHWHVNNGTNDACRQCGLDLRDEVHIRAEKAREG